MSIMESHLTQQRVRILAKIERSACLEVFLELRDKVRKILRQRKLKHPSELRSLNNALFISVIQDGKSIKLSWNNSAAEHGTASIEFRKHDHLGKWLHRHILRRPPAKYGNSRRIRRERREARRREQRRRELLSSISLADIVADIAMSEQREQFAHKQADEDQNAQAA